jgi:hypothetical protein
MKYFEWNIEKNEELKVVRDVMFEDVLLSIMHGALLDTVEHPNKKKYPNQKIFIVNVNDYAYLVPFVEEEKTIIPSRKMTKKYLGGEQK